MRDDLSATTTTATTIQSGGGLFSGLSIGYLIQIGMSIFASYLNWNCLQNQSLFIKLATSTMAFFFAIYYLIFYFVFKIIMGRTC